MHKLPATLARGIRFAGDNQQVIYTLFLIVIIPLGFLFSSEQFLRVAKENQDHLERSRIGMLQDVFVLFAADKITDSNTLTQSIRQIASKNTTMVTFEVLEKQKDGTYFVISALKDEVVGQYLTLDPLSIVLLNTATGNIEESYSAEYFVGGARFWRSVRAIPDTNSGQVLGYVLIDMSMELADEVQSNNIERTYFILALIVILIILLLARQARIIDYGTLYQRLKEVDTMKDDFVSMAAHELRSPLTIIRGYADELRSIEHINEKGLQYIENIDTAANQLNALVADLLDVAKIQAGGLSFDFTNVDVSKQVSAIVESFMRPASDKGLTLTCETGELPLIAIDVDRFRQVMVNFIGNAIKYTPRGSVRVVTSVVDKKVVIRISDTGMGISAEDQKKIFQKFFRIKNEETSRITGTGLGLWITQEIVRNMNGTIAIESIKGKGTDFIVSFPIVKK